MQYRLFLLIAFAMFFSSRTGVGQGSPVKKPNVIFILADDLGYADIGCFGATKIKTPFLDSLASIGMRMVNHYAGSPVCAPSRCVLMTGKHTGQAYVRGNGSVKSGGQIPIPAEELTVAEVFKKANYVTGMIGKWGLGNSASSGDPLNQGFDFYYGFLDQILAHNYYPEYLLRNGEREYLKNKVKYLDSSAWHRGLGSYSTEKVEYVQDKFTAEALNFIEANRHKSFFLYLPFTIPHNNGEAPKGEKMEVPDLGDYKDESWSAEAKAYAAMISRMDAAVRTIVNKVRTLGLEEQTLIIFTSDNGPHQTPFTEMFNSNGPHRGFKLDVYEGGLKVPFIAYWKNVIKPGATSSERCTFSDFLPTICEITGQQKPFGLDGLSYLPVLKGEKLPTRPLYWEFTGSRYQQALIVDKWKLIRFREINSARIILELYDLYEDDGEKNNLVNRYPEKVKEMTDIMNRSSHTPELSTWRDYNEIMK